MSNLQPGQPVPTPGAAPAVTTDPVRVACRAYNDHEQACPQCADGRGWCPDGAALRVAWDRAMGW